MADRDYWMIIGAGQSGGGGDEWEKLQLWKNKDTSKSISEKITLPYTTLALYEYMLVEYCALATAKPTTIYERIAKMSMINSYQKGIFVTGTNRTTYHPTVRDVYVDNNTIVIDEHAYDITTGEAVDNTAIPVAIYGIKKA